MAHPTPPKRYKLRLTLSSDMVGHTSGRWMLADEALAYANALAKHMLDKAAYIARHACLVEPDGGQPSTEAYEACQDAEEQILKLKEAPFTPVNEQPVGSAEQNQTEGV